MMRIHYKYGKKNTVGSAPSMEPEGASRIFTCSIEIRRV